MNNRSFSLEKKNIVITGATGILGESFCHALASAGAQIALIDLDSKKLEKLANDLSSTYETRVEGFPCDVTNPQDVDSTIKIIDETFSGIHVLHNNAATKGKNIDDFFMPYEDFKLEVWKDIMSVNIDGMFLISQAVGKSMISRNIRGSIIQTASIYGVVAPDQRIYKGSQYLNRQISSPAVYSASKSAVIGLTKYLAAYWGEKGIRVNTLTPGGVESGQNETFKLNYSHRVPLGRMAMADEIASALVFLASDASSYITGQNLIVDGGLTVW